MVQLQVHLHVLDVRGCIVEQPLPLTQVIPQSRDPALWVKARPQQSTLVQPLQPLRIGDVGLATGDVLGIPGVDKHHGKPTLFQDLEGRDPVDAGGLHRDRLDVALLEPVGETVQVGREGAEAANRFGITAGTDCGHMHGCTDVDCCRTGMNRRHLPLSAGSLGLGLGHTSSLSEYRAEEMGCATDQFPNRDRRGVTICK